MDTKTFKRTKYFFVVKIKLKFFLKNSNSKIAFCCTNMKLIYVSTLFFILNISPTLCFLKSLVESHGYQLQTHQVQTSDGYILKVHRVVADNYSPLTYSRERKPVIVSHGLFGSSSNFFINSEIVQSLK